MLTALAPQSLLAESKHDHRKLGHNLRSMLEHQHNLKAQKNATLRGVAAEPSVTQLNGAMDINSGSAVPLRGILEIDDQNRVLVEIKLNGTMSMADMHALVEAQGGQVMGEDPYYRMGTISAFIPVEAAETIAGSGGIMSMEVSMKPATNAGLTDAQGAFVHHTDVLNANGFSGSGITVGVMSDSFDKARSCPVASGNCVSRRAADDIASGDLPVMKYVRDFSGIGTDEGRGMAQIVHDMAPAAGLCFATANGGQTVFASNIRDLRTNPLCQADVIVDDVIYFAEPMFTDGQIAQAVNDVTSSTVLPGKRVSYFSSAGNSARSGYSSPVKLISNAAGRALPGINWASVPATIDTTGGFHNFATTGTDISQQITLQATPSIIIMQWDDPWDVIPSGITTDWGILVFSTGGQFIFQLDDDNTALNEPIEGWQINGTGTVKLVFYRHGGMPNTSKYIKEVWFNTVISGPTFTATQATTYGHNSAAGGNGVAAYIYSYLPKALIGTYKPLYESFSAPGPVIITHDTAGNRLASPEVRKKPDMAAVDGVNTTFFPSVAQGGSDFEASYPGAADGFPNFFGTSAAAPTAAAVAALMIEKAGGPGSLTPEQVTSYLQTSAPARDVDKFLATGTAVNGTAKVTLVASGNANGDPNFFTLTFTSPTAGQTLNSLIIDLTGTDVVFNNATAQGGSPLQIGAATSPGVTITNTVPAGNLTSVTLNFSGFTSGKQLVFGIGRRFVSFSGASRSRFADMLGGGSISASLAGGLTATGAIVNKITKGYAIYDGFGLIDGTAAVAKIP
jgi:hypothetical protein